MFTKHPLLKIASSATGIIETLNVCELFVTLWLDSDITEYIMVGSFIRDRLKYP